MNLVMITCAREPAYLDATLDSLFASDPSIEKIHLLVHETNIECMARWLNHPKIDWRKLLPEEHDEKMSLGRRTRTAHAMRLALEGIEGECIFLEDDASFSENWLETFTAELSNANLNADVRSNSVISLRTHLRWQKNGFVRWDPKSYFGTVAMFMGATARAKIVEALRAFEALDMPAPGQGSDVCIQRLLLRDRALHLYARFPNLVEHTGEVSSIGSKAALKAAGKLARYEHIGWNE